MHRDWVKGGGVSQRVRGGVISIADYKLKNANYPTRLFSIARMCKTVRQVSHYDSNVKAEISRPQPLKQPCEEAKRNHDHDHMERRRISRMHSVELFFLSSRHESN